MDMKTKIYLSQSHKSWEPGNLVVPAWEYGLMPNVQVKQVVRATTRYMLMIIALNYP